MKWNLDPIIIKKNLHIRPTLVHSPYQCCVVIWINKECFDFKIISELENCQSWFFEKIRIKELLVLAISKTLKNWRWIHSSMAGNLIFSKKLELWLYTKIRIFHFLRTKAMNPKNHPDNCWRLFPVFNRRPRLVCTPYKLLWGLRMT
jgi:hypothetical protein